MIDVTVVGGGPTGTAARRHRPAHPDGPGPGHAAGTAEGREVLAVRPRPGGHGAPAGEERAGLPDARRFGVPAR